MKLLPYHPRFINKLYADLVGYFWTPCPICGRGFGGHEWSGILMITEDNGKGVCPKCKDMANEINRKNGFVV